MNTKMNEVDRTGEGLTSLLYVHVYFLFGDFSKFLISFSFFLLYFSPPSHLPKMYTTELKLHAGVLAFMN